MRGRHYGGRRTLGPAGVSPMLGGVLAGAVGAAALLTWQSEGVGRSVTPDAPTSNPAVSIPARVEQSEPPAPPPPPAPDATRVPPAEVAVQLPSAESQDESDVPPQVVHQESAPVTPPPPELHPPPLQPLHPRFGIDCVLLCGVDI